MNRINKLFKEEKNNILSIYFTAGYPSLNDTNEIIKTLDEIKNIKKNSAHNLMQENIKMSLSNESENIKKFAVARTTVSYTHLTLPTILLV